MRRYAVSLLLIFGLIATWQLATPVLAAPDEPQHLLKAAAVARGQWVGRGEAVGPRTHLQLPAGFAEVSGYPRCFAFHPKRSAACTRPVTDHGGPPVDVTSTAGRYPPAYYGIVGLPTLLVRGIASDRAARVASLVLCALLLAAAMTWAAGDALALAVPLAVTPMVLFLGAVVNPSGVEVCAAAATWVGLLRLRTDDSRRLLVGVTAAASALTLARPISPLWTVAIAGTVAAMTPWSRLRELMARRDVRVAAAVVAVLAVAQTAWVVVAQSTRLFGKPMHVSRLGALGDTLAPRHVGNLASQMVGRFGWLDIGVPRLAVIGWALALLSLLVMGLWYGSPRQRLVLVVALALAIVVPAVLEASSLPRIGYWWQGRYSLPYAIGLPFVAVAARPRLRPRLLLPLVAVAAVGQVWAFLRTMARYTVGTGHGSGLGRVRWHPPLLPPVALLVVFSVLMVAWTAWAVRMALAQQGRDEQVLSAT